MVRAPLPQDCLGVGKTPVRGKSDNDEARDKLSMLRTLAAAG